MGEWFRERRDAMERLAVDVIYNRRHDTGARLFAAVLHAFSLLFERLVRLRVWLYRHRVLRGEHLGCLVVVVGNLTVGGTGKTPVVERFARSLTERGRKVAILSRGYKSRGEPLLRKVWRQLTHGEEAPPRVVSDGESVLLDSEQAGDEPHMLARNLPGVVVLVDKNRVKAGVHAIRRFGCDTLLLDDGYQYLKLAGQMNLLLIDKTNPFGNGALLPRGLLREPVEHLGRASYVFLTKSNGQPDPALEEEIRAHNPGVEIIECSHEPQFLQGIAGEARRDLEWLKGRRIGCFSGIAVPESFEQFLLDQEVELRLVRRFLDHHRFSDRELEEFFETARAAGLDAVVTTEKDAVRIPPEFQPGIPFYFLRLEIEILRGVNDFEEAVSRVCFPRRSIDATRPPFPVSEPRQNVQRPASGGLDHFGRA